MSARILKPSLWVFGVALIASLSIHLPVYEVLGVLAETILRTPTSEPPGLVELELAPLAAPAEPSEPDAPPAPKPPEPRDEPEPLEEPVAKREAARPEENPSQVEVEIEQEPAPKPVPQAIDNALAVTQKSQDPSVPPPDNPRFIAEENNRVLEESVATVRNLHEDNPEPEAAASPSSAQEPELGNDEETDARDLQNVEGSDERHVSAEEARHEPEQPSEASAGSREAPAVERASTAPDAREAQDERLAQSEQEQSDDQLLRIDDGMGSFVIRKSGLAKDRMHPSAARKGGAQDARSARPGDAAQGGVNLRLSYSQFEDTFGADNLRDQREQYIAQRRSKSRGQSRQEVWKKFRGAIENHVPHVRPGNQTALNTAASPFAGYLAVVHRQIHQLFADEFLRSLPLAGSPLSDPALVTTLEIVINGDGSLHEVGVARSSGFLPFDYGAFSSVMRSAPYPAPPRNILSGDGRVYVHWAFHRNERQCGTFNAQPYILPNPGGQPDVPKLQDQGEGPSPPAYAPREGELGVHPRRRLEPAG